MGLGGFLSETQSALCCPCTAGQTLLLKTISHIGVSRGEDLAAFASSLLNVNISRLV